MNSKVSKKIAKFNFQDNQILDLAKCSKIKGGAYWCCTRNKWI